MNKKILFILIILVSFLLGSCKQRDSKPEILSQEKEITTIRYSLWGNDERYEYTLASVEEFEKIYPEIRVEVEFYDWKQYNTIFFEQRRNNQEADVMEIPYGWMTELVDESLYFKPLKELESYIDLSYFTNDVLKYGSYRKTQYAIPVSMNSSIQLYNKTWLKRKGLDIPKNWDEVKKMINSFTSEDTYLYGLAKDQVLPMLLNYYEQLNGEPSFNSLGVCTLERSDFEQIIQIYEKLVNNKIISPDHDNVYEQFSSGKVVAVSCWNSDIDEYQKAIEDTDIELALGDYIVGKDSKYFGYYVKPASMYVISSNTNAQEASAIFMNYLLNSKENALLQKLEKGVPDSKAAECYLMESGLLNNMEYRAKLLIDFHLNQMSSKPAQLENSTYFEYCIEKLQSYIAGESTLQKTTNDIYICTYKNLLEGEKHE